MNSVIDRSSSRRNQIKMSTSAKVHCRSIAILYDVAYPFIYGGGQRRLYEVGRRMAALGWNVHWYPLKAWEGDRTLILDGIVYQGLREQARLYGTDGKRAYAEALSYGRAILTARVDFSSYDLVWCAQWPLFHILALIARLVPWRTRLLVDWWEVWGRYWLTYAGWPGLGGWLLETALTNTLGRVGHVVADSEVGRDRLLAVGVPSDALTVIPNGVDLAELQTGGPAEGNSDIVYFGRLKDHKNVDHILRALALLNQRDSNRFRLDLIGEGPDRARLQELTQTLGIADQVTFHGSVETSRANALLKRSKVFVHASTQQCGGSMNLLEANACGLPVVCYRHPMGIDPGHVLEGKTGLMVSPTEPESLADGISTMLRLTAAEDVSKFCLAHAKSFDWSNTAERYCELIDNLLSAIPGRRRIRTTEFENSTLS